CGVPEVHQTGEHGAGGDGAGARRLSRRALIGGRARPARQSIRTRVSFSLAGGRRHLSAGNDTVPAVRPDAGGNMVLKIGSACLVGMMSILLATPLAMAAPAVKPQVTKSTYEGAQKFMSGEVIPLADHLVRHVTWLDDERFLYVDHDAEGDHYWVMDAATGKVRPAFDETALLAAAGKAEGHAVKIGDLRIFRVKHLADGRFVVMTTAGRYACELPGAQEQDSGKHAISGCTPWVAPRRSKIGKQTGSAVASPDGK